MLVKILRVYNVRCGALQHELSYVCMRCRATCGQGLRTQHSMWMHFLLSAPSLFLCSTEPKARRASNYSNKKCFKNFGNLLALLLGLLEKKANFERIFTVCMLISNKGFLRRAKANLRFLRQFGARFLDAAVRQVRWISSTTEKSLNSKVKY